MSAAIDRLREDCARRGVALPTTHDDDVRTLLAEHAHQRTRAEAAEAECARLRAELAASIERGKARWGVAAELADVAAERDALAADNARLRAIVEGRETAPTSQEIAVHDGAWIVRYAPARREHYYERVAFCGVGWRQNALDMAAHSETVWWLPLDATGRPCAWPTPVLDAAGEGR